MEPQKLCVLPRTDASGRGVFALAANGSQTGEGNNQGQVQQVPAKRQNRGPATQRVMVLKAKQRIKEIHHGSTWR
jgi:hypothetical protein